MKTSYVGYIKFITNLWMIICIMESYNIKTLNRRPGINYEIGEWNMYIVTSYGIKALNSGLRINYKIAK